MKKVFGILLAFFLPFQAMALEDIHSSIYRYASEGNIQALEKLRDDGYSVDVMNKYAQTPLCTAVMKANRKAVHTLVSMGAKYNNTCMQIIPYEKKYAMGFRKRYAPVQSKLSESQSPIFDTIYALASDEKEDELNKMRSSGVDLDTMNCNMDTPYCQALIDENCPAYETLRKVHVNLKHPCVKRLPSSKQELNCDSKAVLWWVGGGIAAVAGTAAVVAATSSGGGSEGDSSPEPKICNSDSDCGVCEACESGSCVNKKVSIFVKEYNGNCCEPVEKSYCPLKGETAPTDTCSANKTNITQTKTACSTTTTITDLCTKTVITSNTDNEPSGTSCDTCGQCNGSGVCESKIVQISSGTCCETKTDCCSLTGSCVDTCVKAPSCPTCTTDSDCGDCEACESGSCVNKKVSIFVKEYNGNCCESVEKNYCPLKGETAPTDTCSANKTNTTQTKTACSTTTTVTDLCTTTVITSNTDNEPSGTSCGTCDQCNGSGVCESKKVTIQTGTCCNEGTVECCPLDGKSCDACVPDSSCMVAAEKCLEGEFYNIFTNACEKCGLGSYSKRASLVCTPCAVGSYANQLGSTACTACPIRWTTSDKGATACDICETGYEKIGDQCVPECDGGYIRSGSDCTACPIGTYAVKGSSVCSPCPEGSSSSKEGSTYCDICTSGYHMYQGECVKDTLNEASVLCDPGYQANSDGTDCEVCIKGYYSVSGTRCQACPEGSSTNSTGAKSQDECTVCDIGYHLVKGVCQPHCSAGWYWNGSSCQICSEGTFSFNGATSCMSCNIGQYQPNKGASNCLNCPTGTTTAAMASTSKTQCTVCESGYVLKSGVCSPCPAGTYANSGDPICTPCPIGQYNDNLGSNRCSPCSTGRTTLSAGSTECVCDEANGYIAVGENCTKQEYSCGAGYYWDNNTETCTLCEAGTYSGSGELFCTACPYGYFSDKQGSTACQICPTGWTTSSNKATTCDICAEGYEKKNNSCVPVCNAGYVFKSGSCQACPKGYFSNKGDDSCTPCPKGYSTSETGSYTCNICDTNYVYSNYHKKCIPQSESCVSGQYWNGTACTNCPVGTHNSNPYNSSTSCEQCPQGSYADTEGSAYCSPCPRGSTTDIVGATSKAQCNHCAVGYEFNGSECVLLCHDGQFWNGTACTDCPAGSYSNQLIYKEFVPSYCEKCSPGTYNESTGQTSCSGTCPTNATSPIGATSINDCSCKDGFSSSGSGASLTCTARCSAGQYWDGSTCANCAAGTYSDAGATSCETCLSGTYSVAGSSTCTPCPTGYSTSTSGSPECDVCADGYQRNGSNCEICPAGSYSNNYSWWLGSLSSQCTLCPKGKYSISDGSAYCTECPTGYTTSGTGSTSESACSECDDGYTKIGSECIPNNRTCSAGQHWNGSACVSCSAGTYSLAGSTQCIDCPKGSYSSTPGSSSCTACSVGYTTMGHASTSASACSICADGYQSDGTTCVLYKQTCGDGYYYNGYNCEKIPDHGQKSDTDKRGWECEANYTRVGNSCILTSTLSIITNPSGTTLTTGMQTDYSHDTLINDGIINLGDISGIGMDGKYSDAYVVNNGTIKNESSTSDITGISAYNAAILENSGLIELKGTNTEIVGINGTSNIGTFNYGKIVLNGNGSSLHGISNSSFFLTTPAVNYGDVILKSYSGKDVEGLYNVDNYGTVIIEDFQNERTSSGDNYVMNGGANWGNLYLDIQASLQSHDSSVGLIDGINYGQIEIYAKNNSDSLVIMGSKNSDNMNQIHFVSANNRTAIGMYSGSNYGEIKLESTDTVNVAGLTWGESDVQNNYGNIEVISVSSSGSVCGMGNCSISPEYNSGGDIASVNYGNVNVTSIGYQTNETVGLNQTDNYGKVYVSASGNNLNKHYPTLHFEDYSGYGIYEGNNHGEITITGSADSLYGLYNGDNSNKITVDGSKTSQAIGQNGGKNSGIINIINTGDNNSVYAGYDTLNTTTGIINIENFGAGTAYGLYGYSLKNEGQINITNTGSGTVYGIYGDKVVNSGTINITNTGSGSATGIYIKQNGTLMNSGTITINGSSYSENAANGDFIKLDNGATIKNMGIISAPLWDLNLMPITAYDNSQLNIQGKAKGKLNISSDIITSGFNTTYTVKDMINIGDTSELELISQSALFDAKLSDNNSDVVMTMKDFDTTTNNKSLSDFLSKNYTLKNNEAFYHKLKSFTNMSDLTDTLNKLTGKDMLSRFNFEDMTMMRELNFDINEKLFHNKERTFAVSGSVTPLAFKGDTGSNARYSLYNKQDDNTSVGLSVAFTDVRSDDDNNNNNRSETSYQLILPIGYKTNGFNLITSPRIGYARSTYDRTGFAEQSYDGTIEKRVFGLMNEARYPICIGNWRFEPAVEFNILGYKQKGREDAKEFALNIQNQTTYSAEGGIALYATREDDFGNNGTLKLTTGVAAYHEFADPYRLKVGMDGMCGNFTLQDENRSQNRGIIRAGFNYDKEDLSLYGNLMSYIEREWYTTAKTGINWKF